MQRHEHERKLVAYGPLGERYEISPEFHVSLVSSFFPTLGSFNNIF